MTVTVLRPGGRDNNGDPLPGTKHDIDDCIVYPRQSSDGRASDDDDDRGESVIVGLTLLTPAGADIKATDQVRTGDHTYDVQGVPGDWDHPFIDWHPGIQVALTRSG